MPEGRKRKEGSPGGTLGSGRDRKPARDVQKVTDAGLTKSALKPKERKKKIKKKGVFHKKLSKKAQRGNSRKHGSGRERRG